MRIVVIGTGYVGLVSGACLADTGATVICVDVDAAKIQRLHDGEIPIFEPGLDLLVARNVAKGRLTFTTSLTTALTAADVAFIAVGTPTGGQGAADISEVLRVAEQIGNALAARVASYLVVVTKSTVPVGSAERVRSTILSAIKVAASDRIPGEFDVASNPEFLKEGAAVEDFAKPDRIVIGVNSKRAQAVLEKVYRPFLLNGRPVLFMDIPSAELTKYAANAMLALRISFMNQIGVLCEEVGADVNMVRKGIGSDPRIGPSFLYAGPGYGGSCFPKDVRALASTMDVYGVPSGLLREVEAINERQKGFVFDKICRAVEPVLLAGRVVGLWGVSFKPNTDDVRDSPALAVARMVIEAGAIVRAYDPIGRIPIDFGPGVLECDSAIEAATGVDVLVLLTEWQEFRAPDFRRLAEVMEGSIIVDARNVLSVEDAAEHGLSISRIGCGIR